MSSFLRETSVIDCIVFHHTVTDPATTTAWTLSEIDRTRVYEANGVYDTGFTYEGKSFFGAYHYIIYPDGHYENPIEDKYFTWNNGTDKNYTSIAISFVGNYSTDESGIKTTALQPFGPMLITAKKIIEDISSKYNIKNIYGHRDLYSTACPGDWWTNNGLQLIMDSKMKLTQQQVDRLYWAILRRSPEKDCPYVGAEMSVEDFAAELGDSKEHTKTWDLAQSCLQGNSTQYELVTDKLYKKI